MTLWSTLMRIKQKTRKKLRKCWKWTKTRMHSLIKNSSERLRHLEIWSFWTLRIQNTSWTWSPKIFLQHWSKIKMMLILMRLKPWKVFWLLPSRFKEKFKTWILDSIFSSMPLILQRHLWVSSKWRTSIKLKVLNMLWRYWNFWLREQVTILEKILTMLASWWAIKTSWHLITLKWSIKFFKKSSTFQKRRVQTMKKQNRILSCNRRNGCPRLQSLQVIWKRILIRQSRTMNNLILRIRSFKISFRISKWKMRSSKTSSI